MSRFQPNILAVLCCLSLAPAVCAESYGEAVVQQQPAGAMSGKIVYAQGGHGYTAANQTNGAWGTQRPLLFGMVEDFGNKDQMDLFVDCVFRAGATVAPLRPVGRQPEEYVLDNEDPAVTFQGDWMVGDEEVYFGRETKVPCRVAATSSVETAVARYRPIISTAGCYPVYAWTAHGANHASDQLYRIRHAGGVSEVRVNHKRVGHGLVYLGEYYLNAGRDCWVEISNQSQDSGAVVVADMIRLGNGRGDIDRGGGKSGLNREAEAGLYWVMWHAQRATGIDVRDYRRTENDRDATVTLAPRVAALMNREADGAPADRVFVSFHSNAGGGSARGVLGLWNGNNYAESRTPNQELLARTLASEINHDLVALSDRFEHPWSDRGESLTLDRDDIEFGEINNKYLHNEMDATIVESGFHDNQQDAEMLRDLRVRQAIADAACQGLIKYFGELDKIEEPVALPEAVTAIAARSIVPGLVTVAWAPPIDSGVGADHPDRYLVYVSQDGLAFDAGREVAGGQTTRHTLSKSQSSQTCYVRIAAQNSGGLSRPTETVVCRPAHGRRGVLLVTDQRVLGRHANLQQNLLEGGVAERVRFPSQGVSTTLRHVVEAFSQASQEVGVDSATADAVRQSVVRISSYDTVVWVASNPSRSGELITTEDSGLLRQFVISGGNLLLCGIEGSNGYRGVGKDRAFYQETLGLGVNEHAAEAAVAVGEPGTPYEGLRLKMVRTRATFEVPSAFANEAKVVLRDEAGKGLAVHHKLGRGSITTLAFPLDAATETQDAEKLLKAYMGSR